MNGEQQVEAQRIIESMSSMYTKYRTSLLNEDMDLVDFLTLTEGADAVIDLFIAADDLNESFADE